MASLKEQFTTRIVPALAKELQVKNTHAVPRVTKIVVNIGLGNAIKDNALLETMGNTLRKITGQKPLSTKARKSIATFKVREGMQVGMKVTLRGVRMWDFLEKLCVVTFPRVRDFRGLEDTAVDADGNFNYGFREHVAFPEIRSDEIEKLHGLQVTIATTAKTHGRGMALFSALGFPFKSTAKGAQSTK